MNAANQRLATALWVVGLALAGSMAIGWIEAFVSVPEEASLVAQTVIGADHLGPRRLRLGSS